MRDHQEADPKAQNIQMNKKTNARKAASIYVYTNYECCTLQQQLYKKRCSPRKKNNNNNNNNNKNETM